MKEYTKKSENPSHTIKDNSRASKQAGFEVIFHQYKQCLQRTPEDEELISEAQKLREILKDCPEKVDIILLRSVLRKLENQYFETMDENILTEWENIKETLGENIDKVLKSMLEPLFTHIKLQIKERLKNLTPRWVDNLPNIKITKGEDITGGLAVGQDEIFVTPKAGADFIMKDTAEFAFSHEIAHLLSKSIGVSGAKGLLRSDGAIKNSGIVIASSDKDSLLAKFEEIRADIFGADMLASYLNIASSDLNAKKISDAIDAPSDEEHPSFEERKKMLTYFRGVDFTSKNVS